MPEGTTAVYDKTAADIQTDVSVGDESVTGTSKYIADWSSAGFDADDGVNFLVLHAKCDVEDSTIVAEPIPSQNPSPAFNDDDVVFQITSDTTGIKFTVSKEGVEDAVYTFDLDVTLAGE